MIKSAQGVIACSRKLAHEMRLAVINYLRENSGVKRLSSAHRLQRVNEAIELDNAGSLKYSLFFVDEILNGEVLPRLRLNVRVSN